MTMNLESEINVMQLSEAKKPVLCSLLGEYPLRAFKWLPSCIESWQNLTNAGEIKFYWDRAGDRPNNFALGSKTYTIDPNQELRVEAYLRSYPNLREIRTKDFTWRKLLDTTICNIDASAILSIDTDVFIRNQTRLPVIGSEAIIYPVEDIPAYRAQTLSPFFVDLVKSANGGFVLYSPDVVDFDFLEYLTGRFLKGLKNHWWTEQFAWSALAARSQSRFIWSGDDVRVVSGQGTRTAEEMSQNEVKWLSKKNPITTTEELLALSGTASVIHMSGYAKEFYSAFDDVKAGPDKNLRFGSGRTLSFTECSLLSLRLGALNIKDFLRR